MLSKGTGAANGEENSSVELESVTDADRATSKSDPRAEGANDAMAVFLPSRKASGKTAPTTNESTLA